MKDTLVYCYDEETKKKLLSRGCVLLKSENGIHLFVNKNKNINFEDIGKKIMFSNKMTF